MGAAQLLVSEAGEALLGDVIVQDCHIPIIFLPLLLIIIIVITIINIIIITNIITITRLSSSQFVQQFFSFLLTVLFKGRDCKLREAIVWVHFAMLGHVKTC